MEAAAKERSDMFDAMFVAEQKIRLGEPGWKARYYEVGRGTPAVPRSIGASGFSAHKSLLAPGPH